MIERIRNIYIITTLFILLGSLSLFIAMIEDGNTPFTAFSAFLGIFSLLDGVAYLIAVTESQEGKT